MRVHIYGHCATACYNGISFFYPPFPPPFHRLSRFRFPLLILSLSLVSLESPAASILDNVPTRGDDTTDS